MESEPKSLDTEQPLEEALWYDLTEGEQFPTILVLGQKGSGKTHFCLKMIHRLLKESNFKKFHICSPIARFEQKDSYAFLNKWGPNKAGEFPTEKRVYIYPKFKDSLLAAIMARDMKRDPSDLLLWIDDASAGDSRALSQSRYLGDLVSTSRHRRVAMVLCNHSTTAAAGGAQVGVLGPFTRQQASYVGGQLQVAGKFLGGVPVACCLSGRGNRASEVDRLQKLVQHPHLWEAHKRAL